MAGLSENVKIAFEEGRFLDVVRSAKYRRNPEDKLLLGISLFKLGREGEALDVLSKVAGQAEGLIKSFYYLALIYNQKEDVLQAKSYLQKYLAFHPEDDEARDMLEQQEVPERLMKEPSIELAKIYAQQGHYEQALDIYAQVDKTTGLDDSAQKEAGNTQNLFIMKTLNGWLERIKK
jgi:tetratricopeptide (TPR) repeat protein